MSPFNAYTNRRAIIAGSLATVAAIRATNAQTPESESEPIPAEERESFLITGVLDSGGFDLISEIESWDAELNRIGSIPIPESYVSHDPTGKDGDVLITTLSGSTIVDLKIADRKDIAWDGGDPGYLSQVLPDAGLPRHPKYLIAQLFDLTAVLKVDLETGEGSDITEALANQDVDLVTTIVDYPNDGSIGAIWTGDNVYLVDFEDPENVQKLIGDDEGWYSTTAQLSHNGEHVIFTTYDPDQRGQAANVYLQNVASGEYEKILEGHAYTTGFFIPNDPENFMALSAEGLEIRSLSAPAETGTLIREVGQNGCRPSWLNVGKKLLYGHRDVQDGPYSWMIVDMETLEYTDLPDLGDMRPIWPNLGYSAPQHLLFHDDTHDDVPVTVVGLDIENAETWPVVDGVYVSQLHSISASRTGDWYTVSAQNRGTNVGVWLVNMNDRSLYEFPEDQGMISEYAAVSPDGNTVAVTFIEGRHESKGTYVASTDTPEDVTRISDSTVLGWV